MNYPDYRPNIKSGDVLAWKHPTKWYRSWYDFKLATVKYFTKSEYTHVAIAWAVGERVFIIEAVAPLVRILPLSNDLPCYLIPGDGLSEAQLVNALKLVGKGHYSTPECIKAYLEKNNRSDNEWECAEFTSFVLDLPCQDTPVAVVNYMVTKDGPNKLRQIIELI